MAVHDRSPEKMKKRTSDMGLFAHLPNFQFVRKSDAGSDRGPLWAAHDRSLELAFFKSIFLFWPRPWGEILEGALLKAFDGVWEGL